jgi:TatD DNase family protein
MIDTHAHLEQILCDTRGEVDQIILAAANLKTSKKNLELIKDNIFLHAAVGIHPQESDNSPVELEKIVEENFEKIVAIGECGLDFSGEIDKNQESVFRKQIELAQTYDKPLIIHARKAVDEVVEILKEYKNIKGVFHCYAGGKKRIQKVMSLGFYFGIDGNLTYEVGLEDVVRNIPRNRILLETDCPYLTPIPFRWEENKPAYIKYTYQKLAEIWEIDLKETEKIIDANAKKLFKTL